MAAHTLAHATLSPDKTALEVLAGPGRVAERWSYRALEAAVAAHAGGLAAAGIGRGDRVLIALGHESLFPVLFFACQYLGALPVPVSAMLTADELAVILADLEPAAILARPGRALPPTPARVITGAALEALAAGSPRAPVETDPDDPAYIVYTSGTGSRPKGVVHAHRAAWARRMMWDGWYGLTAEDRMLHAGAFNWTYTLGAGLTDPWAAGATALIYAGPPDRGVWAGLARAHGATLFAASPGVYRQLLSSGADLAAGFRGLRHGLSAGEALPDAVRAAWSTVTGKPLLEALGMSEISTYISEAPGQPRRPGSTGRPQPGRRVAILGEGPGAGDAPLPHDTDGLLAVSRRDPGLMLGYWRRPEATAAAFRGEWFLTGDRARMAADGTITYLGRADDVITAGGYRISPAEIEAALTAHPGISEAAAVGQEIRPGVTVIVAYWVGPDPIAEADLAAHAATRLARYKQPRAYYRLDALPRGPNGKIQRKALRARAPAPS